MEEALCLNRARLLKRYIKVCICVYLEEIEETIYYGVKSSFWLKLILLLVMAGLLFFSFSAIMRRILKVEKKKPFLHNHVNPLHKKIDWIIRITFIVAMIIGSIIHISRKPLNSILFFEPYFLLFMFIFLTEIVRAVMEWKYADNRNAYILTVVELAFITILLLLIFITDFFGLFG